MVLLTVLWANSSFAQNGSAHWNCDDHAYEYEMAVYFSIIIDGEKVSDDDNYEIGAFCGTECRGVSEVVSVGDTKVGYIRIRSHQTEGETISFKGYDKGTQAEWAIEERISFKTEELLGMPSSPKELHINTEKEPEQTFVGDNEETVSGYVEKAEDGTEQVVITELSESMLNGEEPVPSEVSGGSGVTYPVAQIASEAFDEMPEGTVIYLPEGVETTSPVGNVVNGDGTCAVLDLTHVDDFNTSKALSVDKVIYNREITSETSTVCLPYDMDVPAEGMEFYTLRSGIDGKAGFEKYTDAKLKAYMPYLMKVSVSGSSRTRAGASKVIDLGATNVVISPTKEDLYVEKDELEMYGIVHGLSNSEGLEKEAYILQAGGTWQLSASQASGDSDKEYLPPFHAYLRVKGGVSGRYSIIETNFSSSTSIRSAVVLKPETWYNLQGLKLKERPTKSGVYIKNGRKVLAK